ncbi:hypothetical protein [Ferrimicrobium sp.]|uniref:hypothetical protein n=1 Tax=Ferrimicrobium sp. TaxID=2926050 RepID=UPI0026382970|nr:hypothetical protein [Ferrimicrobium sp.]
MIDSTDSAEQQRLEAIAHTHRYVLRPCRDFSPGVMMPEGDAVNFPKIIDYFLSERFRETLIRITSGTSSFIVVPLNLIG